MFTTYAELKVKVGPTKVENSTNESERFPPTPLQTEFPDETGLSPEDTSQSRSSKLVGFERGTMRLQPFLGPKQF